MNSSASIAIPALTGRLENMGFSFSEDVLANLAAYLGLLMKWNNAMNLVGTDSWEKTLDTLVADSFHLADFLSTIGHAPTPRTFDLGAGAGLPGIPLRMVWHEGEYLLVEVREKRALFMKTVLASVPLKQTSVFQGKAEDVFAKEIPADIIISRAFMPWREMLSFIAKPLALQGHAIFLTLHPAPEDIPSPWHLVAQKKYSMNKTERFFWCFTRTTP